MSGTHGDTHGRRQTKKATASGWIGSALEYYDFFIYATAASLVFPQLFFPSSDPQVAIVASLATYGVGYVARPIGAFVLGHLGRHARPQERAARLHVPDGPLDDGGRPAAHLRAGRHPRADPARRAAPDPGLRGGGRDLRRELDDPRTRAVRPARLLRELHAAGRAGRPDPRRRRLPAARALHARGRVQCPGAGASRSCSASSSSSPATSSAARSTRRRPSPRRARSGAVPQSPIIEAFTDELGRHAARRLHGADERHPGRRHDLRRRLRGAAGLRHRLRTRTSISGSRCSATSSRCS